MSKTHPMVEHLDSLLDGSEEDAVAIQIQLQGQLQPWNGALRRHPTIAGLYELVTLVKTGEGSPMARQVMGTLTFAGDQVSSTMYVPQAGSLVEDASPGGMGRTPGGLVVPT